MSLASSHACPPLSCCEDAMSMCIFSRRAAIVASPFLLKTCPLFVSASQRTCASAMSSDEGHTYKYPRPGLTVDAAIVSQPTKGGEHSQILLIRRKNPPCKDQWALPGGFVDENEGLDKAAARELEEETSVKPGDVFLEQFGAFGDPGRDPRGWTLSVAYVALVPSTKLDVKAADDAADAQWFNVADVPQPLAFDHKLIVRQAFQHLLKKPEGQQEALKEELEAGLKKLEGPWQPPKE